jgi:chaperone BCS1
MKSVVLGHMPEAKHAHLTIGEYLLANMREFMAIEQWYVARGQAYRREYLLEGLPGTGKTSVVLALAGELELDVYMINLSLEGLSEETLLSLIKNTPQPSIILFEEFDSVFTSGDDTDKDDKAAGEEEGDAWSGGEEAPLQESEARPRGKGKGKGKGKKGGRGRAQGRAQVREHQSRSKRVGKGSLELKDLLQVFDGAYTPEGRLMFFTTNRVEIIDKAMMRRFDVRVKFDVTEKEQAKQLFQQFYRPAENGVVPPDPLCMPTLVRSSTAEQRESLADQFAKHVDRHWLRNPKLHPEKKTARDLVSMYLMHLFRTDPEGAAEEGAVKEHVAKLLEEQESTDTNTAHDTEGRGGKDGAIGGTGGTPSMSRTSSGEYARQIPGVDAVTKSSAPVATVLLSGETKAAASSNDDQSKRNEDFVDQVLLALDERQQHTFQDKTIQNRLGDVSDMVEQAAQDAVKSSSTGPVDEGIVELEADSP